MHINMVKGDFIFKAWGKDDYKNFNKKVHELRIAGYRKINQEDDWLNHYDYYRKKGHKKIITITTLCN